MIVGRYSYVDGLELLRMCSMTHLEAAMTGFLCRPVLELVENVSKIKLILKLLPVLILF